MIDGTVIPPWAGWRYPPSFIAAMSFYDSPIPQDLLGPQAALRIHFLGTSPGRQHLGPGAFSEAVSIRTS